MKTALVLEGGAMRGIYTTGVLDVFLDNGIKFDGVIGVSAGAIHGCTYVAEQNGRNIRYYKKYRSDKHFMSMYSLVTTGDIVGKDFCYRQIPDILDPFDYDTFKKSKTKFYAVVTDVEKGKPAYVLIKDMKKHMEYLRASASMPIVSRMIEIGGRKFLDGGVTDSIPIEAAKKLGYDRIVVVQTRGKGYKKDYEGGRLPRFMYRNYPNMVKAIENRHIMYNRETALVEKLENSGDIIAVRPSRYVNIGRMEKNIDRIEEMYQLGRNDAEEKLKEIIEFLGK